MPTDRILPAAGWVDAEKLAKGPNGRALCRRCGVEVQGRRKTFCSYDCVHEWKIRSQPAYARQQVLLRDHGVCSACGLDTVMLATAYWSVRGRWWIATAAAIEARLKALGFMPSRHFWEADHKVPVCEGGGACGLDNLRTLCRPCHRGATAQLARRRAQKAKSAGDSL